MPETLSSPNFSSITILSEEEMENPERVITSFFESIDLKDAKDNLKEALELWVEKKFDFREYTTEEDDLRFFFEKVEKVMEVSWLMR